MTSIRYIPAGRTALVRSGNNPPLQVQTEYAHNPYPRITTSVYDCGRVLHKIEVKLERPIESIEEQQRTEEIIKRQHSEVVAIVRNRVASSPSHVKNGTRAEPQDSPVGNTIGDRLKSIPGIEQIYYLDAKGNFRGIHSERQFKKVFSAIFKNLHELLGVFAELPGSTMRREQGVCEVERDRLYYASTGGECYFITVRRADRNTDFEKAIRKAIFDE